MAYAQNAIGNIQTVVCTCVHSVFTCVHMQAVNSKDTVVNLLCVKYKSSRGVVDKGMWVSAVWKQRLETSSLPHRLY